MRRAPLALAAATIALAAISMAVPDGLHSNTQPRATATPPSAASAAATSNVNTLVQPIWRLDVPKSGGPFVVRVSPDARMAAVESGRGTGIVVYEIQSPVAPSDLAALKELVRLDHASGGVQWLPNSSVFLAYEPDGPSSPTGTLSLFGASGRRWSIATTGMVWSCCARFSPDGRNVAFWMNPRGALVVALDGTAAYSIADDDEQIAGLDAGGSVLFNVMTANAIEARSLDQRVAYIVHLPEQLRGFGGSIAAF